MARCASSFSLGSNSSKTNAYRFRQSSFVLEWSPGSSASRAKRGSAGPLLPACSTSRNRGTAFLDDCSMGRFLLARLGSNGCCSFSTAGAAVGLGSGFVGGGAGRRAPPNCRCRSRSSNGSSSSAWPIGVVCVILRCRNAHLTRRVVRVVNGRHMLC